MEWRKVLLIVAAAMLLIWVAPELVHGVSGIAGLVVGALLVLFVYNDARQRRMEQSTVLFWTALTFITTFWACEYGLATLILYLIVTRGNR